MKWVYLALLVISGYRTLPVILCVFRTRPKLTRAVVVSLSFDLLLLLLLLFLVREMFGAHREAEINRLLMWLFPAMILGDEIVARLVGQESPWQNMWRHRNDPVWPSKSDQQPLAQDRAGSETSSDTQE